MIKYIVTTVHLIQFFTHSWFMYQSVFAFSGKTIIETFWHQIKLLTKLSNWAMFSYLIPFVICDIKNFNSKKIKDRYPTFVHLLFQGMNPIIFLVMISYQILFHVNPKLLFMDGLFPDEWQLYILFYQHFTNWALMQLDYFLYEHQFFSKVRKSTFFCVYISIYFSIYGAYYYFTGKHVYGFQESFSLIKIIILNASQFSVLFLVDFINSKLIKSKHFQPFILENHFYKSTETNKKNE